MDRRLLLFAFLFTCGLSACSSEAPVAEAEYASKIVGEWQGTVGDNREVISFNADGRFACQLQPLGFIANTLGQGVTGTIRGTWAVDGKSITLNISSAEDERVLNKSTASTVQSFRTNELKVRSAQGETSTFVRL
jgi:uncharacterized protein (TIGR03066 family)